MRSRGKPAHVDADLRQDDLGADFADPRDGAQLLDGVTKGGESCIDLPIDRGDAGIEHVDLLQMEIEQKAMVPLDASAQGFAQACLRRPDLGMRERGQLGRVGLAGDQRLDHRPAGRLSAILRDIPPCAVESRDGPSERRWVENTLNDFNALRLIDDQPPDLASVHRGQLCRDDFDVPVHRQRHERVELAEALLREGGKIQPPQNRRPLLFNCYSIVIRLLGL